MKKYVKPTLISILALNLTQCVDTKKVEAEKRAIESKIIRERIKKEYPGRLEFFVDMQDAGIKVRGDVFKSYIELKRKAQATISKIQSQPINIPRYTNQVCGYNVYSAPFVGPYETVPYYCKNPRYEQEENKKQNRIKNIEQMYQTQLENLIKSAIEHDEKFPKICEIATEKKTLSNEFADLLNDYANRKYISFEKIKSVSNKLENHNDEDVKSELKDRCFFINIARPGTIEHWLRAFEIMEGSELRLGGA